MFESLFKYPRVIARHRAGPFAEARERFLKHCVSEGLANTTLLRHARELLVMAERIDITLGETIGSHVIEAAADRWAREQHDRHRARGLYGSRQLFIATATEWLRFLGLLVEPKPEIVAFASARLADFATYQRDERGLSPATIHNQGWYVDKFLRWVGAQNRSFQDVRLEDVDAFLADGAKRSWGRLSVASCAKALRAFFRYAAARGWCAINIAAGIDGPHLFQHEGLPAGPPWPDVQRLIASTGGDSARDIRDRAILMLFANYGFRSGEVASLCLEDLNWQDETVSIARSKTRRVQEYPLVNTVGEAIL